MHHHFSAHIDRGLEILVAFDWLEEFASCGIWLEVPAVPDWPEVASAVGRPAIERERI
jgi:hypothetical protein